MQEVGKLILMLALLVAALILARRLLIFVRALVKPVSDPLSKAVRPIEDKIHDHVDQSLRAAGMDQLADGARKLTAWERDKKAAIGKHLDAEQQRIQDKRERKDPTL